MAKLMSAPELLRSAVKSGSIPAGAEISRRGEATWAGADLAYSAWITKSRTGALEWYVNISDAKFSQLMGPGEAMGVIRVRSLQEGLPWPEKGDDDSLRSFLEELGAGVNFIRDRRDLVEVLASKSDVARDRAYSWLPPANYPSRLVQAFILATDMNLSDLAGSIKADLLEKEFVLADRSRMDMRKSAQRWARQYSRDLGILVDISE